MTWIDETEDAALIESLWPDAPSDPSGLLKSAEEQCVEFAPALAEGIEVPERYKVAVIYQARALHRSGVAGGNDQVGSDYPVTVFPMDWTVKALLRPSRGVPGVF